MMSLQEYKQWVALRNAYETSLYAGLCYNERCSAFVRGNRVRLVGWWGLA